MIEECPESSAILDAIFDDSYARWGGLKTLIVPVQGGIIEESYLKLIEYYDPDVIYTYADLSDETLEKLDRKGQPALFVKHKQYGPRSEYQSLQSYFKPSYGFEVTKSISLAPMLIGSHLHPSSKKMLRKHIDADDSGFLADNFGFFDLDLSRLLAENVEQYELFTFRPENPQSKCDLDGEYITSEIDLMEILSDWRKPAIYTPTYFSGKDALTPGVEFSRSYYGLKIFLGDSFKDRINFWNSRHGFKEDTHVMPFYVSLRVPEANLNDDKFISLLGNYIVFVRISHNNMHALYIHIP